MTPVPERQTVRPDEQRFPCKYDGPRDYARLHVDGEGDIGLLVRSDTTTASIYLHPEIADLLSTALAQAAVRSRDTVQEIQRVRAEEEAAALRVGELDAARQAEQARQEGQPYLVAGGSTLPTELPVNTLALAPAPETASVTPQPPTFADVMLPATDTAAERERAFLRAAELLGPDAGVASKIAMASFLLKGPA
ncbi:hypothetical protein ACIQBJ_33165 [Kitasatospora sp. NPDC088391]|uniref:hypothetical protein n=1 Tax=Kitasatospora sp. NPDC088391 TaxID=3364074 RepID=UPI0037F3E86E